MFNTTAFTILFLFTASVYADSIDITEILAAHNKLRTEAGVTTTLGYSPKLAKSAQAWANHLQRTHACQIQHSDTKGRYGENLYWASPLIWSDGRREQRKVTPTEVIDAWGNEKTDYDHASNTCTPGAECGHYTQIVWRDTTKVGCGFAVCSDSHEQLWVCHYAPAGNRVGEKPY